jgi:hypothetical protein
MDPRWNTDYAYDYKGPLFFRQDIFQLPATVNEKWCKPGYQPMRPDKGIKLVLNDYYYHKNRYGKTWDKVAYTSLY